MRLDNIYGILVDVRTRVHAKLAYKPERTTLLAFFYHAPSLRETTQLCVKLRCTTSPMQFTSSFHTPKGRLHRDLLVVRAYTNNCRAPSCLGGCYFNATFTSSDASDICNDEWATFVQCVQINTETGFTSVEVVSDTSPTP